MFAPNFKHRHKIVPREWRHSLASGDAVSGPGSKNGGDSAAARVPKRVILPPPLPSEFAKQVRYSSYTLHGVGLLFFLYSMSC